MATRAHIPLLAALSALAAGPAGAKVYVEWKPRASFFAGFNDNVLLDGSGADGFGQARPGIRLDLFGDHQFHVDVDCEAGIGRLLHPDKFALNSGGAFATSERCIAHYNDPGNGAVFTPSIGYAYRTSPYDNLTLTGREQLFYSFGATPQASAPQGVP